MRTGLFSLLLLLAGIACLVLAVTHTLEHASMSCYGNGGFQHACSRRETAGAARQIHQALLEAGPLCAVLGALGLTWAVATRRGQNALRTG